MTVLKSLLYLVFEAGLFAVYIPLRLLAHGPRLGMGMLSFLAIPFWLIGSLIILQSFWDFTFRGRGTPLPTDPPKELVVTGFFRYVRNPIYVGVMLIFLAHFLWFGYWALLLYTLLSFIGVHFFIILYEEPMLKRKFGAAYEEYIRRVPRWIPRFP
ncbi:MAG TPA: isoprenylcysteine carboxylmethyltransferase family protein [Anaerolineales bacterium]|nr:isoprenylcysteine carboxylmethyltransferase family protein [Anaerolineales bacterium]